MGVGRAEVGGGGVQAAEGEQLFFVSDPQLRRARALFPCVDEPGRWA